MKKFLVIGSNSFSGSTFSKYCLSIGHEVHGVSRSIEPSKIFLPHYWSNPQENFKFLQIDLNYDQNKLIQLILDQAYDCIFNFAAQSMVGESWSNPNDWLKTNILSVSELLINLSKIKISLDLFISLPLKCTAQRVPGSMKKVHSIRPLLMPFPVLREICYLKSILKTLAFQSSLPEQQMSLVLGSNYIELYLEQFSGF